jgi:hypothetical protein
MKRDPFTVDLTNPDDMAAKLAEGERILREINEKLAALYDLQRESQEWRANVEFLASKVPDDRRANLHHDNGNGNVAAKQNGSGRAKLRSFVVAVVNREVRKIRPIEVRDILASEGHDFSPEQVSNALHYAAQGTNPKLIQKARGRGMYAPLEYHEAELPSSNGHAPVVPDELPAEWGAGIRTVPIAGGRRRGR